MAEVYDRYLFYKLFKPNVKNQAIYWKSKFGRLIYNVLRSLKKGEAPNVVLHCFTAFLLPIRHQKSIKSGDLAFFNASLKK
jgi:hypothetical protein